MTASVAARKIARGRADEKPHPLTYVGCEYSRHLNNEACGNRRTRKRIET